VARSGFLLTLFTVVQILGAFALPALADRSRDRRPALALALVTTGVGLAAIVLFPLASPWTFTTLLGFGIGGLFPLALTLPLDYSPDPDAASRLTAMTLGVGYLLAALGPLAMGALRDTTGSYATSFTALVALTAAMLVSIPTLTPAKP
jgi:MFS transporter, CP family, cyanate transporter